MEDKICSGETVLFVVLRVTVGERFRFVFLTILSQQTRTKSKMVFMPKIFRSLVESFLFLKNIAIPSGFAPSNRPNLGAKTPLYARAEYHAGDYPRIENLLGFIL